MTTYSWRPGETVRIKDGVTDLMQGQVIGGAEYVIEGFWDQVAGKSWMESNGNPAALQYAMRSSDNRLPIDNKVLYGKIGSSGHLVHESEIEALDG